MKLYFEKRNYEFTVTFFEQRVELKSKFNQDINFRLDQMKKLIKDRDKVLFGGVKKDK